MTLSTDRLSGIWLPLITPFHQGELDEVSLVRLVRHYRPQPIAGIIVGATTGEGLVLAPPELERVVSIAAAEIDGRMPLFLGQAGSDTRRQIGEIGKADNWPIDGHLISCPYYSRPSQEGLYRHFAALAGATEKRLLIYNIPYRTGINLGNETLLRLAEIDNIAGLKDCCADAAQTFDLLKRRPEGFAVLTGEDLQTYAAMTQGADGAILASAHLATEEFWRLHRLIAANDHQAAFKSWRNLADLVGLLFAEPSPAAAKYLLYRQGLIASPEIRLPMTEVSPSLAGRLERWLDSQPVS